MSDVKTEIEYNGRKLTFKELLQLRKDKRKDKGME